MFHTHLRKLLVTAGLIWACAAPVQAAEIKAVTQNLPPFSMMVDGKVGGFSNELLDLMLKESGVKLTNREILPWVRAYAMAQQEPNTLIYTMARTPDREKLFQWVGPISKRRIYLYKRSDRKDIAINTFDDARKYTIGVLKESASAKELMQQGFEVGKQLDLALDDEINMKKFRAKRFDLLVSMDWTAIFNAAGAGMSANELEPAFLLDDRLEYWYGLSLKTDPVVAQQLNVALDKIKKDGRYAKLTKKYLPDVKPKAK